VPILEEQWTFGAIVASLLSGHNRFWPRRDMKLALSSAVRMPLWR